MASFKDDDPWGLFDPVTGNPKIPGTTPLGGQVRPGKAPSGFPGAPRVSSSPPKRVSFSPPKPRSTNNRGRGSTSPSTKPVKQPASSPKVAAQVSTPATGQNPRGRQPRAPRPVSIKTDPAAVQHPQVKVPQLAPLGNPSGNTSGNPPSSQPPATDPNPDPVPMLPVIPLGRPDNTKPKGGGGFDRRGPPNPPPDPPKPHSDPVPEPEPDLEWDLSPLILVTEFPLYIRDVPPSAVPSPLGAFSKEQVDFYLIKEYGDELYKSWLQANGEWHGVPEQPDTDETEARPAIMGLKEAQLNLGIVEPELSTSIWAPKMVGKDLYFQTFEERIDNQLEAWEQQDSEQLRPDLGPTAVFQHTVRYRNYGTSSAVDGMHIWNGLRGGVYRFPSAAPMSTERKPDETSDEFYARYDDAVEGLLKYPSEAEAYEGGKKDRRAWRGVDGKVVRREFAIDIRRLERRFVPKVMPIETPKKRFKRVKRPKETIIISDVGRKTEDAFIEDQRDGRLGGTGYANMEERTIPTIDIANLYAGSPEEPVEPWIVPEDKELELRAVRKDTVNPDVNSHGPSKRPYQFNEFDEEKDKDRVGIAAYFVINTDPRPLKINGTMLLYQGQVAGPLPSFAWFEAPGGQISFWWGISGADYKPVPKIARAIADVMERYAPDKSLPAINEPGSTRTATPRTATPRTATPRTATPLSFATSSSRPASVPLQRYWSPTSRPTSVTSRRRDFAAEAEEQRQQREQAAAKREAQFRQEQGDKYGRNIYRVRKGLGTRSEPKADPLGENSPKLTLHLRGGGPRPRQEKKPPTLPPLLRRIIVRDAEYNYTLIEVWDKQDDDTPTISRQRKLKHAEAMELEESGVEIEDEIYPTDLAPPPPKRQRIGWKDPPISQKVSEETRKPAPISQKVSEETRKPGWSSKRPPPPTDTQVKTPTLPRKPAAPPAPTPPDSPLPPAPTFPSTPICDRDDLNIPIPWDEVPSSRSADDNPNPKNDRSYSSFGVDAPSDRPVRDRETPKRAPKSTTKGLVDLTGDDDMIMSPQNRGYSSFGGGDGASDVIPLSRDTQPPPPPPPVPKVTPPKVTTKGLFDLTGDDDIIPPPSTSVTKPLGPPPPVPKVTPPKYTTKGLFDLTGDDDLLPPSTITTKPLGPSLPPPPLPPVPKVTPPKDTTKVPGPTIPDVPLPPAPTFPQRSLLDLTDDDDMVIFTRETPKPAPKSATEGLGRPRPLPGPPAVARPITSKVGPGLGRPRPLPGPPAVARHITSKVDPGLGRPRPLPGPPAVARHIPSKAEPPTGILKDVGPSPVAPPIPPKSTVPLPQAQIPLQRKVLDLTGDDDIFPQNRDYSSFGGGGDGANDSVLPLSRPGPQIIPVTPKPPPMDTQPPRSPLKPPPDSTLRPGVLPPLTETKQDPQIIPVTPKPPPMDTQPPRSPLKPPPDSTLRPGVLPPLTETKQDPQIIPVTTKHPRPRDKYGWPLPSPIRLYNRQPARTQKTTSGNPPTTPEMQIAFPRLYELPSPASLNEDFDNSTMGIADMTSTGVIAYYQFGKAYYHLSDMLFQSVKNKFETKRPIFQDRDMEDFRTWWSGGEQRFAERIVEEFGMFNWLAGSGSYYERPDGEVSWNV